LGPAYIGYRLDGSIECEWYLKGQCLGRDEKGFWALWDSLTDDQRQKPELLKYLAMFL
jgi:hypothetical protein